MELAHSFDSSSPADGSKSLCPLQVPFTYRNNVALDICNVRHMSSMLWLGSAYRALAISIFLRLARLDSSVGLPPFLPLALAACNSALVGSLMMSRKPNCKP